MGNIKVLLAEDELSLAHIVRESLEERDFKVILCHDGESALRNYLLYEPDILVLDVMMPKKDGFEVAKQVRETDRKTPIIFLTARSQSKDVVAGFELGANDYLKKPFSIEELIVRIKVQLNRDIFPPVQQEAKPALFQLGSFQFNPGKNILERGIEIKQLTSRESEVLRLLCMHHQEILQRQVLLNSLWGSDNPFNARSLDVFITKLRKHLANDPSVQIINVRGVGYKLVF